jgi:TatD DNase family protein
MLIDSHCHLPEIEMPGGVAAVIAEAQQAGIGHLLCVAIDEQTWPDLIRLCREYPCVSASIGVHPNANPGTVLDRAAMLAAAGSDGVVAIGETGLDYFRSEGDLAWQQARFREHIHIARELKKPLIVHSREARDDVIRILKEESAETVGGVMHCFVDDLETAGCAMDLGFYISFSGIVTFRNADALREVARKMPLERMLVETDAPYLAPAPHRGKQNRPAFVRPVAECLAELRGLPLEEIARVTTENFYRLFPSSINSVTQTTARSSS